MKKIIIFLLLCAVVQAKCFDVELYSHNHSLSYVGTEIVDVPCPVYDDLNNSYSFKVLNQNQDILSIISLTFISI